MTQADNGQSSLLAEVRQLKTLIDDLATGLRNQQALLSVRKMSLPPVIMDSVTALQHDTTALERTALVGEVELRQLRSFVSTSVLINSSLDVDAVLSSAMDQILELAGAERGYILLRNANTDEVEFRIAREHESTIHPGKATKSRDVGFQVSTTILNEVLETGQPVLSDNAQHDPRMEGTETLVNFVLRSVLCVPLHYKDRIIGAVYVDNRLRAGVFTERELSLLSAFANQIAVAIENAHLFADLQNTLAEITEMKDLTENVFASIGSGIITTDADNAILTYNDAAASIFNRALTYGEPLAHVLPMDEHLTALLQTVQTQNQTASIEVQPEVHGRGRVVLNLKLSPLRDATQQTQGVAMIVDDLTSEREREETLAVMNKYLPPGMVENIHHIAQLALGGERREMTCLFADVCPLHTFPDDLNSSQIMELLNVYLARATDAMHQRQGLIDKYIGSEIMVMFNSSLNPIRDHCVSAIYAALDLRDALIELYESLGLAPDTHFYRIGIHTGVATVGNVGSSKRRNFTAIGDTINLAKRLQENAEPGQIIVSEHVLPFLNGQRDIRLEERGKIQVKGRQQRTAIYEVFRAYA